MKYNIAFFYMVLLGFIAFNLNAQSGHSYLRKGDKKYSNEDYLQAEEEYRKALVKDKKYQSRYNLGNSIYKQGRFEEAVKQYEDALESSKSDGVKSLIYHNLGNAYYNNQKYEESVESYKNALRLNPNDIETKYNLALAQRQLQLQQPPPPQPNNEQSDQNEDEQQDQQQQQQDQNQNNQQQDQQDQQQQQQQQQEENKPQESKRKLTKEEVQKLLEIIEQEEQKVQEKLRKSNAQPTKSKKDW